MFGTEKLGTHKKRPRREREETATSAIIRHGDAARPDARNVSPARTGTAVALTPCTGWPS